MLEPSSREGRPKDGQERHGDAAPGAGRAPGTRRGELGPRPCQHPSLLSHAHRTPTTTATERSRVRRALQSPWTVTFDRRAAAPGGALDRRHRPGQPVRLRTPLKRTRGPSGRALRERGGSSLAEPNPPAAVRRQPGCDQPAEPGLARRGRPRTRTHDRTSACPVPICEQDCTRAISKPTSGQVFRRGARLRGHRRVGLRGMSHEPSRNRYRDLPVGRRREHLCGLRGRRRPTPSWIFLSTPRWHGPDARPEGLREGVSSPRWRRDPDRWPGGGHTAPGRRGLSSLETGKHEPPIDFEPGGRPDDPGGMRGSPRAGPPPLAPTLHPRGAGYASRSTPARRAPERT